MTVPDSPLPPGFDLFRWRTLETAGSDGPWPAEQVRRSSAGRPWRGLFVWHQIGPAGDLYIPPQHNHAVMVRRSTPTSLSYRRGPLVAIEPWRPGDSMVLPAGLPSFWRSAAIRDNVHIVIDPAWLVRASGRQVRLHNAVGRHDPVLTSFADVLLASLETATSMSASFAEHMALGIAVHLLEHYADRQRGDAALTPRQMTTITDAVSEGLDQKWPLSRLAELVGLSPFHFARSFKASFGLPPHAWVCARRLETAARLLRDTRRRTEQIAAATGYSSTAHFSQAFRHHWGITPTAYRRAH